MLQCCQPSSQGSKGVLSRNDGAGERSRVEARGRSRRNGAAAHPCRQQVRSGDGIVRDVWRPPTPSLAFRGVPGRSSCPTTKRSNGRAAQHVIWEGGVATAHPRQCRGKSEAGLVRDVRRTQEPSAAFRGMPGRSSWTVTERSTIRSAQHTFWEGRAAALPAAPMASRWAGRSYGRCGTFRRRRGGPQCSQGGRRGRSPLGLPSVLPARRRTTSKWRGLLRRSSVHLTSDL